MQDTDFRKIYLRGVDGYLGGKFCKDYIFSYYRI